MTPLVEEMCDSPNTGRYRAAITADLEGAFDATWHKGPIYEQNLS